MGCDTSQGLVEHYCARGARENESSRTAEVRAKQFKANLVPTNGPYPLTSRDIKEWEGIIPRRRWTIERHIRGEARFPLKKKCTIIPGRAIINNIYKVRYTYYVVK